MSSVKNRLKYTKGALDKRKNKLYQWFL